MAQDRRARVAVAALFLTNGAIFANLLPRYPEIKADLRLSNAVYGAAIAAFSGWRTGRRAGCGGADPPLPFVAGRGRRHDRHRGVRVRRRRWRPSPLVLAAALFVAGASDAITDVAQNAHGLRVQRNYGRSIINSFHAVWAVGRGPRRLDGCGRDRAAHPADDTSGGRRRRCSARSSSSHTPICCAARITTTIRRRGRRAGRPRRRRCTRRWWRWWSSRSRGRRSRTPEVPGPQCICATASVHRVRSRRSATSRWSGSCSSAG